MSCRRICGDGGGSNCPRDIPTSSLEDVAFCTGVVGEIGDGGVAGRTFLPAGAPSSPRGTCNSDPHELHRHTPPRNPSSRSRIALQ
jgi:hypothetical protein